MLQCKAIIVQKYEETKCIKWIIINASMVCGGILDLSLRIVGMKLDNPWNTTSRKLTGHFAKFKEITKKFKALNFEVKNLEIF